MVCLMFKYEFEYVYFEAELAAIKVKQPVTEINPISEVFNIFRFYLYMFSFERRNAFSIIKIFWR